MKNVKRDRTIRNLYTKQLLLKQRRERKQYRRDGQHRHHGGRDTQYLSGLLQVEDDEALDVQAAQDLHEYETLEEAAIDAGYRLTGVESSSELHSMLADHDRQLEQARKDGFEVKGDETVTDLERMREQRAYDIQVANFAREREEG